MSAQRRADHEALAREARMLTAHKVASLQRRYEGADSTASALARAELAQLRRINSTPDAVWLAVGRAVFDGWPLKRMEELGATQRDLDKVARAVEGTLALYAMHQQSALDGRAVIRKKDETDDEYQRRLRWGSFGYACRQIEPDLDNATCVRRRLTAIERSSDFDSAVYSIRSLVKLMKSSDAEPPIVLDYGQLSYDLYLLQLPGGWRERVLSRWSREYFSYGEERDL